MEWYDLECGLVTLAERLSITYLLPSYPKIGAFYGTWRIITVITRACKMKPVHVFQLCFFKSHFNIPSTSRSSSAMCITSDILTGFCLFLLACVCHVPSYLNLHLINTVFVEGLCSFLHPSVTSSTKIFSSVLTTLSICQFQEWETFYGERPGFTFIQKNRQNYNFVYFNLYAFR